MYKLCEHLKVVFVGEGAPTEGEIPEPLTLTTTVIDIDPCETEHYTGYIQEFSSSNQKSDSESDNGKSSNNNSYNLNNFIKNNSIGSASELRPSRIIHVDDVPITKKELTLLSFQKLINSINHQSDNQCSNESEDKIENAPMQPQLIYVPHSYKPLNEYEDTTLFLAAFPVLYPYGIGGHEGRLSYVTLKKYANILCNIVILNLDNIDYFHL